MERSLAELKVNFHCEGHYIYDCLWKVEGVFVCACACACACVCGVCVSVSVYVAGYINVYVMEG